MSWSNDDSVVVCDIDRSMVLSLYLMRLSLTLLLLLLNQAVNLTHHQSRNPVLIHLLRCSALKYMMFCKDTPAR